MTEYRNRIYRHYVSLRAQTLVPETLGGLKPRGPYLNRLIHDHFPDDRNIAVFDLGCGYGALVHYARRAGYKNIRGVDGSPEQVAAARRLGIEGVEEGDIFKVLTGQADESIDLVLTFDVIEHFDREELIEFADNVRRILRPGGRWIIHSPNGESPFHGRIRYGDLTHEIAFTQESINQMLLSTGFSGIRCYEDVPVPNGLKSSVRWVLWKAIRCMLRFYIAVESGGNASEAIFSQNFLVVAEKP